MILKRLSVPVGQPKRRMGACAVCERDGTGGEMEPELVVALAVDEGGSTGAEAYMPVERLMADSPLARR